MNFLNLVLQKSSLLPFAVHDFFFYKSFARAQGSFFGNKLEYPCPPLTLRNKMVHPLLHAKIFFGFVTQSLF